MMEKAVFMSMFMDIDTISAVNNCATPGGRIKSNLRFIWHTNESLVKHVYTDCVVDCNITITYFPMGLVVLGHSEHMGLADGVFLCICKGEKDSCGGPQYSLMCDNKWT